MSETTTENVQDNVQEVATNSQNEPSSSELSAIAESKKYRQRAQKVEAELATLQKQVEDNRTKRNTNRRGYYIP